MGSIRLNHLDLSVAQYLDTATGELAPRQTPAQRKCGGLLLEEPGTPCMHQGSATLRA